MGWSLSPIGMALVVTAVTLVVLASVAWRRRGATRGARSFTFFMLAAALWALLEALQASDPDPLRALTWRQLKYVGIAGLPVGFLVFAHDYTRGAAWLNRFTVALLVLVASVTVALTWTNPLHGLMWTEGVGAPERALLPIGGRGGWFWVHTAYSYVLIGLASFYVLRGFVRTPRAYRAQLRWVLIAVLIPWAANVVVLIGNVDTGGVDVTPLTFALSAFAFARSLFSHRLLDIVPVAQASVVKHLSDAVAVIDDRGRTLQVNPAAARLLSITDTDAVVGEPLARHLADAPDLVEALRASGPQRLDVTLTRNNDRRAFEAQVTPLTDRRGRVTGRLIRLQDIGRQVEAERMLALAETTLSHQESYVLALQEVTEGLMRRAPIGDLLDVVMRRAAEVLEAPHGYLDLVDVEAGLTQRERSRGRFDELPQTRVRSGEGLAGRVWATRGPLRIDDYARWDGRLHGAGLEWVRAAVGAPLASREGVHGVLVLARDRDDRRPFDAADEAELARFAELAALAVLNVRTIDELEARRRESEQLARIGTAMQEASGVDERMALVLEAIPRTVGLRRAVIWLPDASDEALEPNAWVGFGDEARGVRVPLDGAVPLLQEAYRSARESVVEAQEPLPRELRARAPFRHHPLVRSRAAVVLPLVARGHVVGVLAVDTPDDRQALRGRLEVLRRIATNAALAIDAAELLATAQAEVTERRSAELELRSSEEKYRGILEQIEEAYFETDLRGTLTMANPALLRSVGLTRARMVGHSFRHVIDPSGVRDIMAVFREVARSGQPMTSVELRFRRADGSLHRGEMSVSLVRDRSGAPIGFRGVVRDVEDRMLQQEELQAAKDAAEAANASKSVFLANVSHELRTPLTSILGFARLIERRFDEVIAPHLEAVDDPRLQRAVAQVRGNAGIIGRESRRLTSLINDVLDLAKIEAGKVDWRMERLAPREVVEQALDATRGLLDAKPDVVVRTEFAAAPDVIGDRDRLVQVMINLISNAVKFTPAGEVWVTLAPDGGDVRVAVRDTGVGIAPEDHAAVFEQFQQVGDTLTEKPQGTGLGLPICRQIVEHHGGRLWLESALGEGSVFAFTLPALRPVHAVSGEGAHGSVGQPGSDSTAALEAGVRLRRRVEAVLAAGVRGAPLPPASRAVASGGSTDRARSPATVLVVDDDPHVRALLRHALEEDGHEVLEAGDGVSALAIVRSRPPDLVVLDVLMPHLSGFDVVAARNGDLGRRAVAVVILSIVDDAGRGYRLGVERYLSRPVDVSTLVSDVATLARPSKGPDGSVDGACVALVDDAAGEAGERSLALRAEAAIANAGYRVVRVASVAAAARLEPAATVVVMTRAVAERDDGLAFLRREERLRNAAVVVHP